MGPCVRQIALRREEGVRPGNPPGWLLSPIPGNRAVPAVSECEVRDLFVQQRAEQYHVRHKRDLVPDGRQYVVPKARVLLRIGELSPRTRLPLPTAKFSTEPAEFLLRVQSPDRELGFRREVAASVPFIDTKPRSPQHERVGQRIGP